jgi:hypothetical protein
MKRFLIYGAAALVGFCLFFPRAALCADYRNYYNAYDEEKAVVTKNDAGVGGRVFTKTYEPDPEELLVLAGDRAFLLKTRGLFMQGLGMSSVFEATVKDMDDATRPAIIDCTVGSPIVGATLEATGDGRYTFVAWGDRYEVRLKKKVERDPNMFVYWKGRLVSRTERVGTKSEGPEYYLVLEDGREVHIVKNANLWEDDPRLHKMLEGEVWVSGALVGGELIYSRISYNVKAPE